MNLMSIIYFPVYLYSFIPQTYPFTVVMRYFVNVNETQSITENVIQERTTIEYDPVIGNYSCGDIESK